MVHSSVRTHSKCFRINSDQVNFFCHDCWQIIHRTELSCFICSSGVDHHHHKQPRRGRAVLHHLWEADHFIWTEQPTHSSASKIEQCIGTKQNYNRQDGIKVLVPCCVQVFTDEYVALRKSSDGGEADVQFCLELRDLGCSRSFLAHNLVCDQVCRELFIWGVLHLQPERALTWV